MAQARRILPKTPWSAPGWWSLRPQSLAMLCFALVLFGIGEGMLVNAGLGSAPWTVLAQGIAVQSGLDIGTVTFLISAAVLVLWLPLRQRPGLGTVLNMVLIAAVLGVFVQWVSPPAGWLWRVLQCVGGVAVIGIASSLYLTCYLGAGPRDGLMIGLCQKTGWRVGVVRTLMESSVCLTGWLLGGVVGLGTLLFAFGVGWVVQASLRQIAKRYPQQTI